MHRYRKISRVFAVAAIVAAIAACLTPALTARQNGWDADAARRKADYLYQHALATNEAGKRGSAAMLTMHAAALDPEDLGMVVSHGRLLLALVGNNDSAEAVDVFERFGTYMHENPDDYAYAKVFVEFAHRIGREPRGIEVLERLHAIYPEKTEPRQMLVAALLNNFEQKGDTADYRRALELLDSLEQRAGINAGLRSQMAYAYALASDYDGLRSTVDTLVAARPNDVAALIFAGDSYRSIYDFEKAESLYKRANEADTTDGRPYIRLAAVYLQQSDSTRYEDLIYKALAGENIEYDEKHNIMLDYVRRQYGDSTKWDRIQELFRVLERVNPDESRMFAMEAAFEEARNNKDAAREKLEYAVSLDPSDLQSQTWLVQSDYNAKLHDRTIEHAHAAGPLFPDNFLFPVYESLAYMSKEQPDSAIAVLTRVKINEVHNPRAVSSLLQSLSDAYHYNGQVDSAIAVLERVIALDNNNFSAYNNLSYYLAQENRDIDRAVRYGNFAVLAEPENPTYLDTYAYALFKAHRYGEAMQQIDEALRYAGLSATYVSGGDTLVVPTVPIDTAAVDTSLVFEEVSDDPYEDIEEEVEELFTDGGYDLLVHAGDIYFMAGNPEAAVAFWKEALLRKPDDELTQRKVKHRTFFYE